MKKEQNISDNLENEAPFLSKMTKENHFSAPDNYFESLPEVMSNKNLNNNSIQNLFDKLSWRILVPFTAVVIIFTVITNLNTVDENAILTYDQLSEYIITEEDIDFDEYMVYEAYAETIEPDEYSDSETDEYINYLMENDIDINSIIEEL
tara:strand:+ start:6719 stop:7168 length:450 start_codon:yes stop_codon:yes gene_type:complete